MQRVCHVSAGKIIGSDDESDEATCLTMFVYREGPGFNIFLNSCSDRILRMVAEKSLEGGDPPTVLITRFVAHRLEVEKDWLSLTIQRMGNDAHVSILNHEAAGADELMECLFALRWDVPGLKKQFKALGMPKRFLKHYEGLVRTSLLKYRRRSAPRGNTVH